MRLIRSPWSSAPKRSASAANRSVTVRRGLRSGTSARTSASPHTFAQRAYRRPVSAMPPPSASRPSRRTVSSTMRRVADMAASSQAHAVRGGPPVQREHGPELLRAIGPASHVLRVECLDGVPPHARQEAAPRADDVTEEVAELAAEPLTDGRLEAALAPVDDLGGQH